MIAAGIAVLTGLGAGLGLQPRKQPKPLQDSRKQLATSTRRCCSVVHWQKQLRFTVSLSHCSWLL